jgi:hypothetical protein
LFCLNSPQLSQECFQSFPGHFGFLKSLQKIKVTFLDLELYGSRDLRGICRVLRRHEETLLSNGISLRSFSIIIHNLEKKQQEQYDKIMSTMGEYGEKISEIEVECYKLRCSVQYISNESICNPCLSNYKTGGGES